MSCLAILVALVLAAPQEEDLRQLSGMSAEDVIATEELTELDPDNRQFKKLLYRTGTVDPVVLESWATRGEATIQQLDARPQAHRFHPVATEARVHAIHRFDYDPGKASDFVGGFHVADCRTPEGHAFTLVSRLSVASWPVGEPLAEPQRIQLAGFYLGNLSVEFESENIALPRQPLVLARRFSWHPESVNESLGVDAGILALASAGVDISLLDVVKARKGKSIGTVEANCFWQLLSACQTISRTRPDLSPQRIGFADMLRKPIDSVGKAASVQGRVRQCVAVKVTSPEVRELLGTDTWYQLTVFPDLDGRAIEVATGSGKQEVYRNAFPVTVCIVDLPPGLDADSTVGKVFQYEGFFYRIWSYPAERTENSDLEGQPSPLMMASSMIGVKSTRGQLQMLLTAILLAMAIAVGLVAWFVIRSRPTPSRRELPEQIQTW